MAVLKQSTTYTRMFLMVQSSDHITGLTGATPAVTISKAGGSFASAGGTVTEVSSGWYKIALTTTDTNTLGDLAYHITAASGDPTDFADQVAANILGDTLPANVTQWNGTNVSSPATAGIPDINVKNINNVSASSITTISANQGTTQPINFTGTGASALVKSDTVDIAGSAVSTSSAQIGVNLVNVDGSALSTHATGMIPADLRDIVGSAVSTTSAQLGTNTVSINAVSTSSVTAISANQGTTQPINFTGTAGSALVKSDIIDIASSAVSTSTAQIGTNTVNWGTTAVGSIPPDATFIRSGTAQAGGATTITLDSGASSTNNLYANEVIFIRSGTGAGQTNIIISYVGSTKIATVGASWAVNPDNTSVFTIWAVGPVQASVSGTVDANVIEIAGSSTAAQNVSKANEAIGRGTCTTGGSTTSITTSAWVPGGSGIASGQFIGRTIIFDSDTATESLQGQATSVTANTSGSNPTFTVVDLTTAPSSGDTFGLY